MKYDVIIIGAGPGGIFSAYELVQQNPDLKIAVFESGHPLEKRRCFFRWKIQYHQRFRWHSLRVYRQESGHRPDEICG